MPNTILASMAVRISADLSAFESSMSKAQRRFTKLGKSMQETGRNMSTYITLPLVAAGGAAVKLAGDFEASFAKIENLVGISADQVAQFKKQTLELSKITGKGPNELADALFVVTSAGLRGADAIEVLERSAKASAIGLGETKEVARATTAVMQAYGKENISAAQAADTLVNIVREGNLEASELAPVLGRVIGVAAELGVGFGELGANIATFTRLGVDSSEAVTALRGFLSGLLNPSEQARQALADVELSTASLRKSIKEDGLARTLLGLKKTFEGNEEALAKVIPNVRALSDVLGVTGKQAGEYLRISDSMKNSTGLLDEAFQKQSKTFNTKVAKAFATLKVAGIELGNVLLPTLTRMAEKIGELVHWFSTLSSAGKKTVVVIAAILAAIGPLLFVIGNLVIVLPVLAKGIGFVATKFKKLSLSMVVVALKITAALAVIGGLVLIAKSIYDAWGGIGRFFENLWVFMKATAGRAILSIITSLEGLSSVFGIEFSSIKKTLNGFVAESEKALQSNGINTLADVWSSGADAITGVGDKIVENFEYVRNQVTGLFSDTAKDVKKSAESIEQDVNGVDTSLQDLVAGVSPLGNKVGGIGGGREKSPILAPLKGKGSDVQDSVLPTAPTGLVGQLDAVSDGFFRMKEAAAAASAVVQDAVAGLAIGLGESLADLATGQGDFTSFLNTILSSFGNFVVDFGKLLIGYATAQLALKFAFSNPATALAAGVALVAIGSVIKKLSQKGPEAPGLATGTGFIPSDGLFNLHQGEAVIPKKFNSEEYFGGGGAQEIELSLTPITVGGDKLQFVLDNYQTKVNRLGG